MTPDERVLCLCPISVGDEHYIKSHEREVRAWAKEQPDWSPEMEELILSCYQPWAGS